MTAVFLLILFALGVAAFAFGPSTAGNTLSTMLETPSSGEGNVSGPNSDGSLTGSPITNDTATWPGAQPAYPNGSIWDIVTAVALAEGYNDGPGAAPYDLNNPGDLSPGDEAGQATQGPPQTHGGSSIIFFALAEGGFIALYTKFFNIASGNSKVYPASWTWAQVAAKYAGDSTDWLNNVTNYLGVDSASTPAQYAGLA